MTSFNLLSEYQLACGNRLRLRVSNGARQGLSVQHLFDLTIPTGEGHTLGHKFGDGTMLYVTIQSDIDDILGDWLDQGDAVGLQIVKWRSA